MLIIQVFDGEIGEQSSISELMSSQVNLLAELIVMHVVLSPFGFPFLCMECHGEGSSHLDGLTNWQIRRGLVVEES